MMNTTPTSTPFPTAVIPPTTQTQHICRQSSLFGHIGGTDSKSTDSKSIAHDIALPSTVQALHTSKNILPGTNIIRPFSTAAPTTYTPKAFDTWIKQQPVARQHPAALHDALSTLQRLLTKVSNAEQSTFPTKQHCWGYLRHWQPKGAMMNCTSCCCWR